MWIWLIVLFCNLSATSVLANEFNFSVEPVQPETQVDKEQTYFDIKVTPGKEQELVIHMRNDTEKEVKINPSIAPATTNMNGVVEYSPNDIAIDQTLTHNLEEIVTTEKEIVIPKRSTYDLKLTVTPPNESFAGVIAGGITLKEEVEELEEEEENGLAINNEYSYVVGIVLHSDSSEKIAPVLNVKKVYPSQVNARNVIITDFQNPQPDYLNTVTILSEITRVGSQTPIIEQEKQHMQMAPNTTFSYPVSQEGKKLQAGKHQAHIIVYANQSKDGQHEHGKDEEGHPIRYQNKWEFTEEFVISKEKAREFNKKDVTIKQDYTMWYIIGGLILIIVALLIWMYRTKKNEHVKKDN